MVCTDANRVKQILINLLSNAIKYTQMGSVEVTCSQNELESFADITVQDSGCGISESKKEEIFTPFIKIMENRQYNQEGVGLGLSISKQLAEALKGDLKV